MYDSTIFNRYINEIGDPKIQEIVEEFCKNALKNFIQCQPQPQVNITRLLLLVKVD